MLADDSLGAFAELRAEQLSERRILLHPRAANEAHYDHVVELCRRAGFEPMVLDRSVAFDPANLPISDGRAIAIVGESVTISIAESMVWRPLADPFASFDVYLIVNPERRRPANAAFIRHARAYAAEIGWI